MKKKQKHFDNKNDILNRVKHAPARAWTTFMLMAMYVLRKQYGFGGKRCDAFIHHMIDLDNEITSNQITVEQIKKELWDEIGIIVESSY